MNFFDQKIDEQIKKNIAHRKKHNFPQTERGNGHTIGDFIGAVMAINNKKDAILFYRGYLEWLNKQPAKDKSKEYTDEQVAKLNIGWCFGEGMSDKRISMWSTVTGASHPVFGSMVPTAEEAFKAGVKLGKQSRKK